MTFAIRSIQGSLRCGVACSSTTTGSAHGPIATSVTASASRFAKCDAVSNDSYPQLPILQGRLRPGDHAFASGGVFRCPANLEDAVALAGNEPDGALIFDVWRQ